MATLIAQTLVEAPPRQANMYGLFSALPFRPSEDNRWNLGAEWDSESCEPLGDPIGMWTCDDEQGEAQTVGLPKALGETGLVNGTASPFTVYGDYSCSPIGTSFTQMSEKAITRLENREEAAVEAALWTGKQGNVPSLVNSNTEDLDATAPSTPEVALATLENWISVNYGSRGVVHMSRGAALIAMAHDLVEKKGNALFTKLGTQVVAGTGYPGTSPTGADPTAGAEWIYVSPALFGYQGEIFDSSNRPGDLLDRGTNTMTAIAERTYLIGFDSCGTAGLQMKVE